MFLCLYIRVVLNFKGEINFSRAFILSPIDCVSCSQFRYYIEASIFRNIGNTANRFLLHVLRCSHISTGILEWLETGKGHWMGFLTRSTMERAQNYQQAQDMLANTLMIAPAYFILGGTKPGEVWYSVVILRIWFVLCMA